MDFFRNTVLSWWQATLFKWGVFGCGLLLGGHFPNWIGAAFWPIAAVTVLATLYVSWVWMREHRTPGGGVQLFGVTWLTWWQLELFEIAVFGCGLLVGLAFAHWIQVLVLPIALITFAACVYITLLWYRQHRG